MHKQKVIETYKEKDIGIIHLNNPPLNIINKLFKMQLDEAITWAEDDKGIKVLVFRNTGKYFGAGGDIKEMQEEKYTVDVLQRLIERITNLPMPTIAAIDGSAYGGSFELALACDMRIAIENSIMAMTEVDFGSFPGAGGTSRLIQLMGRAKSIEVMLMAYKWTAQIWEKHGVINAIPGEESAFEMAMKWADEITKKPFSGPRAIKDAVKSYMEPRYKEFFKEQQRIMESLIGEPDIISSSKRFVNKNNNGGLV